MIEVNDWLSIREEDLEEAFVRSPGPGGQNVNKVATAVQLRFDAARSPSLPEEVRLRLLRLAGKRATSEGVVIIEARRFRARERNRQDALERLLTLLRAAAQAPKARRPTSPTRASRERRLSGKRRRAELKRRRGERPDPD